MKDDTGQSSKKRKSPWSEETVGLSKYCTGFNWETRQLVWIDKDKFFECVGYFEAGIFKTFTDTNDLRFTKEHFTCSPSAKLTEDDIRIEWSQLSFTITADKVREFFSPVPTEKTAAIDTALAASAQQMTESAQKIAAAMIARAFAACAEEKAPTEKQAKLTTDFSVTSPATTSASLSVSSADESEESEDAEKDSELVFLAEEDSAEDQSSPPKFG